MAQGTGQQRVHQRRAVGPTSASSAATHRAEQAQERVGRMVLFPFVALYLCAYLGALVHPRHPSLPPSLPVPMVGEEHGVGLGPTSLNMSTSVSVLALVEPRNENQSQPQLQSQAQARAEGGVVAKEGQGSGGIGSTAVPVEEKDTDQQADTGSEADTAPGTAKPSLAQRCEWEALRRANATYTRHLARRERAYAVAGAHLQSSRRLLAELVLQAPYPCVNEERLGLWGEGGKWVCRRYYGVGRREPTARVVSVGSKGDTSFEKDVQSRLLLRTHTFDPFLSRSAQLSVARARKFITFHKAGLTGTTDALAARGAYGSARMLTVFQLLEEINVSYVDIMKIDCEGCELAVVEDLARLPRDKQPLGQVLIELHGITRVAKMVRLMKTMESLGYRLFHVEDNPYCRKCYEVAFIHETLVDPRLARHPDGEPRVYRQQALLTAGERQYCTSILGAQAQGALRAQYRRRARRVVDPLGLKGLKWQAMLSRLLVPVYSCPGAQRLGKWGLGGKWVCRWSIENGPAAPTGISGITGPGTGTSAGGEGTRSVYSDGGGKRVAIVMVEKRNSSESLSFEREACVRLNATVHLFDPGLSLRLKGEVRNLSRCIVLHEQSLSQARKVYHKREKLRKDLMAVREVPKLVELPYIDILSTNCKGCEHDIVAELSSVYTHKTVPYGQLLIQMHNSMDGMAVMNLLSRIQGLGYLMFHVDRVDSIGATYEVAFVHERLVQAFTAKKAQT